MSFRDPVRTTPLSYLTKICTADNTADFQEATACEVAAWERLVVCGGNATVEIGGVDTTAR